MGTPVRVAHPLQRATAEAFITPALLAQAEEVRVNQWDWHPEAKLPDGYMLVAFEDGVWITDAEPILNNATRLARVGDSWSSTPPTQGTMLAQ